MTVNPHDAEEALRPYLGNLHEATERRARADQPADRIVARNLEETAVFRALDKALDLLGVQR